MIKDIQTNQYLKVTDTNVYWLPEQLFTDTGLCNEFIRCIPREYDVHASIYTLEDGRKAIKVEKPKGCENLNYFQGDYQLQKQLEDMKKGGVDYAVMKLPGCQEWLSLEMCKKFNTWAYEFSQQSNGKMIPLAVVPPFDDEECLQELDRCIYELGMKGVQVSAHYGNHYLDDEMFRGFFKHINALNVPVYVHHTPIPVNHSSLLDYNNLRRSFGRCQDQVTAIGRELFSGMFEECPNLKMIHSMLGGGYFAFKDMLIPHGSGQGRFDASNGEAIRKYLNNNIYFEMSHSQPWGKDCLKVAAKILKADHILYGSSYPVKEDWMTKGPQFVADLDISFEDKEKMLYLNSVSIYGVHHD
ncbi:MAG: amidohydrolase family protein [Floccifex sp.]